ncbi:nucleotidyltransferase domain-containing protein [Paenibacillus thermotolerans]|uniref:nucleotidyltransferase domain-containing protein n=1 Tax=Paenibacillus thermotolerans TaxID=3027807 RepID=UPI00236841F4|nr:MULTISPECIES: nucleotidyltransferase domain-containing protein [unclassified Paenibacillus]
MIPANIKSVINNFLEQDIVQRGHVETVVLCGSFATGRASIHSDIDLCYIGQFFGFQRESIFYQGREFQLMIAPWSWYEHVVTEYERNGTNIATITVMLATGICLYGDSDQWKTLKAKAVSSYNEGPNAPSVEEIRKIRVRITKLWEDLCDAETERDRQWLSIEILQKCVESLFVLRNWWAVKTKYQLDELKAHDSIMVNLLANCIDSLGSKDDIKNICLYVLEPVGGWMKES